MREICDKCITCHWYCDDVLEECKGQEEPCFEYSPCMEIRWEVEQNDGDEWHVCGEMKDNGQN